MLEFEDQWNFSSSGEFVFINAYSGGKRIVCKVSREVIEDIHVSTFEAPETLLGVFQPLEDQIKGLLNDKFIAGAFESDGSILISN